MRYRGIADHVIEIDIMFVFQLIGVAAGVYNLRSYPEVIKHVKDASCYHVAVD